MQYRYFIAAIILGKNMISNQGSFCFQVVSALYKAFGQTFIYDDHFLSIVGAICSFFNCSGRLIYGFIMDKTSYKVAMSIESVLLTLLGNAHKLTVLKKVFVQSEPFLKALNVLL